MQQFLFSRFFLKSQSPTGMPPVCTVICEDSLPKANNESKMTLKEYIPAVPAWAENYNKKLDVFETFEKQKHLFRYLIIISRYKTLDWNSHYTVLRLCLYILLSGDTLVYHCDNEIDGVYGGIDETFESFKCTDEGLYDIPNPSKQQLERGEHGWPLCISQVGCKFRIIAGFIFKVKGSSPENRNKNSQL